MTYIRENWIGKDKRAEQARKHTKEMELKYINEIKECVHLTKIYGPNWSCNKNSGNKTSEILVEDIDSVGAVMKYGNPSSAVLNFSSYKNPGGMFINGSKAQEECLCHESFLYNVLKELTRDFYDWNNTQKNRALYLNRGLFTPSVKFFRDNLSLECSVITCAAPNKSAAQKYQNVSNEENTEVLRSRIRFVLDIAKDNNIDTLILGAYGCGVFGQNPTEVAEIFKEYLNSTHKNCFSKVIFAIPSGRDRNLQAFEKVFCE